MDPINLGIKFVKASQPGPDVPGTDVTEAVQNVSGNGAGGLTQTGDWMAIIFFALLAIVALAVAGFVVYRNRQMVSGNHSGSSLNVLASIQSLGTKSKVAVIGLLLVAAACIAMSCFAPKAFAVKADSPLVPSKSTITATVANDDSFTLDTCVLANTSDTDKYTIDSAKVIVTDGFSQDVKDALNNSSLTITGFGGTVFSGKASGTDYSPQDITALEPGASSELTFDITLSDDDIISQLLDKQVFNIALTPAKKVDAKSLKYAEGQYYHPVFPDNNPPAGITFFADDDGTSPITASTFNDTWDAKSYTIDTPGSSFTAVRLSDKNTFKVIYAIETPTDCHPNFNYQSDWAKTNLFYKDSAKSVCLENVERLYDGHTADWANPVNIGGLDPKIVLLKFLRNTNNSIWGSQLCMLDPGIGYTAPTFFYADEWLTMDWAPYDGMRSASVIASRVFD